MKALIALSCLFGMARAIGGGGCPLNYGDSCGWMESYDGSLCFKPIFHGKSLMDAAELCWALGNYECPSELMYADEIESVLMKTDPNDLPLTSRVNAKSYCADCEWKNVRGGPTFFPGPPLTPNPMAPHMLPEWYEDHHIISAVYNMEMEHITGYTPAQDRVGFVCTSCVALEFQCPVICEYCIPRPPMDGKWSEWGSWSACTGTCESGTQTRERYCSDPMWDGSSCVGQAVQVMGCETGLDDECTVDGDWSPWSSWGICGGFCGLGTQQRSRSCDDPPPSGPGASSCSGSSSSFQFCDAGLPDCVPNQSGYWCSWEPWGSCDEACGLGVQNRTRACECPPQSGNGVDCSGDDEDVVIQWCKDKPCPHEEGEWASWSSWYGRCPLNCDDGSDQMDTRHRYCEDEDGDYTSGCMGPWRDGRPCDASMLPLCDPEMSLFAVGYHIDSPGQSSGNETEIMVTSYSPSLNLDDCSGYKEAYYDDVESFYFPSHAMIARWGREAMVCGGLRSVTETIGIFDEQDPDHPVNVYGGCTMVNSVGGGFNAAMQNSSSGYAFTGEEAQMLEPRARAAVVQLTPWTFMLIGGGPRQDIGCTTEIFMGEPTQDTPFFVPGPNIPGVKSMTGSCGVAVNENCAVVHGGRVDGTASRMMLMFDLIKDDVIPLPSSEVAYNNHVCGLFKAMDGPKEMVVTMGDTGTTGLEIFNFDTSEWRFGASSPRRLDGAFGTQLRNPMQLVVGGGIGRGVHPTDYTRLYNEQLYFYSYGNDTWEESAPYAFPVLLNGAVLEMERAIANATCEAYVDEFTMFPLSGGI